MKLLLGMVGQFVIGFVIPVLFVRFAPWPRRWGGRAFLAIIVCWFALVWFMTQVYCPMFIADAEQRGAENPYRGCDNNNIAPLIFLGWGVPAIPLGLWALIRWSRKNAQ